MAADDVLLGFLAGYKEHLAKVDENKRKAAEGLTTMLDVGANAHQSAMLQWQNETTIAQNQMLDLQDRIRALGTDPANKERVNELNDNYERLKRYRENVLSTPPRNPIPKILNSYRQHIASGSEQPFIISPEDITFQPYSLGEYMRNDQAASSSTMPATAIPTGEQAQVATGGLNGIGLEEAMRRAVDVGTSNWGSISPGSGATPDMRDKIRAEYARGMEQYNALFIEGIRTGSYSPMMDKILRQIGGEFSPYITDEEGHTIENPAIGTYNELVLESYVDALVGGDKYAQLLQTARQSGDELDMSRITPEAVQNDPSLMQLANAGLLRMGEDGVMQPVLVADILEARAAGKIEGPLVDRMIISGSSNAIRERQVIEANSSVMASTNNTIEGILAKCTPVVQAGQVGYVTSIGEGQLMLSVAGQNASQQLAQAMFPGIDPRSPEFADAMNSAEIAMKSSYLLAQGDIERYNTWKYELEMSGQIEGFYRLYEKYEGQPERQAMLRAHMGLQDYRPGMFMSDLFDVPPRHFNAQQQQAMSSVSWRTRYNSMTGIMSQYVSASRNVEYWEGRPNELSAADEATRAKFDEDKAFVTSFMNNPDLRNLRNYFDLRTGTVRDDFAIVPDSGDMQLDENNAATMKFVGFTQAINTAYVSAKELIPSAAQPDRENVARVREAINSERDLGANMSTNQRLSVRKRQLLGMPASDLLSEDAIEQQLQHEASLGWGNDYVAGVGHLMIDRIQSYTDIPQELRDAHSALVVERVRTITGMEPRIEGVPMTQYQRSASGRASSQAPTASEPAAPDAPAEGARTPVRPGMPPELTEEEMRQWEERARRSGGGGGGAQPVKGNQPGMREYVGDLAAGVSAGVSQGIDMVGDAGSALYDLAGDAVSSVTSIVTGTPAEAAKPDDEAAQIAARQDAYRRTQEAIAAQGGYPDRQPATASASTAATAAAAAPAGTQRTSPAAATPAAANRPTPAQTPVSFTTPAAAPAAAAAAAPASRPATPPPATTQTAPDLYATLSGVVRPGRSLREGSTGPEVIALQQFLQEEGYLLNSDGTPYTGRLGGYYSLTSEAVKRWQRDLGLTGADVDGRVGVNTLKTFMRESVPGWMEDDNSTSAAPATSARPAAVHAPRGTRAQERPAQPASQPITLNHPPLPAHVKRPETVPVCGVPYADWLNQYVGRNANDLQSNDNAWKIDGVNTNDIVNQCAVVVSTALVNTGILSSREISAQRVGYQLEQVGWTPVPYSRNDVRAGDIVIWGYVPGSATNTAKHVMIVHDVVPSANGLSGVTVIGNSSRSAGMINPNVKGGVVYADLNNVGPYGSPNYVLRRQ